MMWSKRKPSRLTSWPKRIIHRLDKVAVVVRKEDVRGKAAKEKKYQKLFRLKEVSSDKILANQIQSWSH